jgi:formate hydrogenlyase subunit 3/multisubunit Na+/H+ antiporter MnhD subunit
VLGWWAVWVTSEVLAVTTALLNLRTSVQARADGVLWYAVTDLVAVAVAVVTLLVVGALTGLVAPATVRGPNRMSVVRVEGAPVPQRAERPSTSAR